MSMKVSMTHKYFIQGGLPLKIVILSCYILCLARTFAGFPIPVIRLGFQKIKKYVPILEWLPKYEKSDLKFDGVSGITSMSILSVFT